MGFEPAAHNPPGVGGDTPRPVRQAQVTRLIDAVQWKLSVVVGGDGLEPTASWV